MQRLKVTLFQNAGLGKRTALLYTARMRNQADIIILGAGASGLAAAKAALARGRKVMLIDHAAEPARKLLIAGGGKCNLTNLRITRDDYVGKNPNFCRSALARLSPEMLLRELRRAGIALEEREHGQIFCRNSAKDLADYLLKACEGAVFRMNHALLSARKEGDVFTVATDKGNFSAPALIIALGGPAWPQAGASAAGYATAEALGHAVVPPRPALTGLVLPQDSPFRSLAGIAVAVSLTHPSLGALPPINNLPLLFTHKGTSGPAALQASLAIRPGDVLSVNFLPTEEFSKLTAKAGGQTVKNFLRRLFPDRLADVLAPQGSADMKVAELPRPVRLALQAACTEYPLPVAGLQGYAKAEVTAGGVDTAQVSSKTMESRRTPGLYFCGEVLDITGRLGGYNLHWAFASGTAAGESAGFYA